MDNSKYFTADLIYNRLSRTHAKRVRQYSIGTFIEWCATVEINYIGSFEQFKTISGHKLTVENNRAKLPCNIYNILDVMDGDERIYNYRNNGAYLFFDNQNFQNGKEIIINYHGIPVDPESNLPLLLRGHEEACEKYCLYQMLESDYIDGKVADRMIERVASQFDDAVDAAQSSQRHVSVEERHQMIAAMANMIPNPNYIPTQNNVTNEN